MKLLPFKPFFANIKSDEFEDLTSNAKNLFQTFVANGKIIKVDKACMVSYRITNNFGVYLGLIALNSFEGYENILGHEKTLIQKEDDHINVLKNLKAIIKPVLIGYEKNEIIEDLLKIEVAKETSYTYLDPNSNELHEFWIIEEFGAFRKLFETEIENCFIADGHHRYATVSYLKENKLIAEADFNGLLCYYMSFDQLKIFEYNRVLNLGELSFGMMLKKLEKLGTVTVLPFFSKPESKYNITIANNKLYFNFRWNDDFIASDEIAFDVDLFNSYILEDVFGIEDSRLLESRNYVEGTVSLSDLEESIKKKKEVVFVFYPIESQELIATSLEGNYLPPKSTWFYPRIKSGLISSKI
jgi:uncharacterized protein (DUF1015 family)